MGRLPERFQGQGPARRPGRQDRPPVGPVSARSPTFPRSPSPGSIPRRKNTPSRPIKKFEQEKAEEAPAEEKAEKPAESDIRIIKSEFRVDDTGEAMDVNGFPTKKYVVSWIVDWENVRTGEKGTNKLETDVRTTPLTDAIVKAQEEEAKYFRGYMKAMGLDQEKLQQDVLGTNWMSLLDSMNAAKGRPAASFDASKTVGRDEEDQGLPRGHRREVHRDLR